MASIIVHLDTELEEDVLAVAETFRSVLGLLTAQYIVRSNMGTDQDLADAAFDKRLDDVIDYVNALTAVTGGVQFIPEPRGAFEEYYTHQWRGEPTAVIESETNPWIEGPDGPQDFGPNRVILGALVSGTEIQAYDEAYAYESDLHAAQALADVLNGLSPSGTDEPRYTVWFHGAL